MKNITVKLLVVYVILALVPVLPVIAASDAIETIGGAVNTVISASNGSFVNIKEAAAALEKTKSTSTPTKAVKQPEKPGSNATAGEWNTYCDKMLNYIDKLDTAAKKQSAWTSLSATLLSLAKSDPDKLTVAEYNKVMSAYSDECKTMARTKSAVFDTAKINNNLLDTASVLSKSSAYTNYTTAQRATFLRATNLVCTEMLRGTTKDSAVVTKISGLWNSLLTTGNIAQKAQAYNYFSGVYNKTKSVNGAVAKELLKDGLSGVNVATFLTQLKNNINNTSNDGTERANIAIAANRIIAQRSAIKKATGDSITSSLVNDVKAQTTDFLNSVVDNKVAIPSAQRGVLASWVGKVVRMSQKSDKQVVGALVSTNSSLESAYISFSRQSLNISGTDVSTMRMKSSTVSSLYLVNKTAAKYKNTDLVSDTKKLLLGVDAKSYEKQVNALKVTDPDIKASLLLSRTRLAVFNLNNNTGVYSASMVKDILSDQADFNGKTSNLQDMRYISVREDNFNSVDALYTVLKSDDSKIKLTSGMESDINICHKASVAIGGTRPTR